MTETAASRFLDGKTDVDQYERELDYEMGVRSRPVRSDVIEQIPGWRTRYGLPTQMWIGAAKNGYRRDLAIEHFQPVSLGPIPSRKPEGGLWTSTYDEAHGSSWIQACLWDMTVLAPKDGRWDVWLAYPEPTARVYQIDTLNDLRWLASSFLDLGSTSWRELAYDRHREFHPNWLQIAQHWDAVYLTERGQAETRIPLDPRYGLYGWDCESTLWLNWRFERVEHLGFRRYEKVPIWEDDDDN